MWHQRAPAASRGARRPPHARRGSGAPSRRPLRALRAQGRREAVPLDVVLGDRIGEVAALTAAVAALGAATGAVARVALMSRGVRRGHCATTSLGGAPEGWGAYPASQASGLEHQGRGTSQPQDSGACQDRTAARHLYRRVEGRFCWRYTRLSFGATVRATGAVLDSRRVQQMLEA